MFVKDSPPMTRRQNILFWTLNAAFVLLSSLVVGWEIWAPRSFAAEWTDVHVKNWDTTRIPCGRYTIGSNIMFSTDTDPIHVEWALACRDWQAGQWVIIH